VVITHTPLPSRWCAPDPRNLVFGFWFLVCYAATPLATPLLQRHIQVVRSRVQGLPIKDCARGCINRGYMWLQLSAIDMTEKTFFERMYLVLGLRKIALCVSCPCAPTTPTVHSTTISRFLCNFFPRTAPHFFGQHDSRSNLAESRYTRAQ